MRVGTWNVAEIVFKEVGGRGPGPRRRAGAMAEALGAARRQEPRPMF